MKLRKTIWLLLTMVSLTAYGWNGSGTSADPYLIRNSADWATLASETNSGNVKSNVYFKLVGDISAKECVGTADHPFEAIFDGGGNTINCALYTTSGPAAPFAYMKNASIMHLKVAGTIQGGLHSAGVVGKMADGSDVSGTIEDCYVSATITALPETLSDGKTRGIVAGGVVGHGNLSNLSVNGCLFDGQISGSENLDFSYAGAMVGWCENAQNVSTTDCVENGTYSNIAHTGLNFDVNRSNTAVTTSDCYSLNHNWTEAKKAHKVLALSDDLGMEFYSPQQLYTTTKIQPYWVGMAIDGVFYAGSGDEIMFSANVLQGYKNICTDGEILEPTSGLFKFSMPNKDVYISYTTEWGGSGTNHYPYLISSKADWQKLAVEVKNGNSFSGTYFKLTDDIDIYTPIGKNDESCSFAGVFDGDGHTITAHIDCDDSVKFVAPFTSVNGARISNLRVVGDITGGIHVGGLVGRIFGKMTVIENCRVSATIHALGQYAGGFIGHAGTSSTAVQGCLFDGKISGSSLLNTGLIIGWCESEAKIILKDCLAIGDHDGQNVSLGHVNGSSNAIMASNTYYLNHATTVGNTGLTIKSSSSLISLHFIYTGSTDTEAEYPKTYETSGIITYNTGMQLEDDFIAASGEKADFVIWQEGLTVSNVQTDHGTLTNEGSYYSLTLDENTPTISASLDCSTQFEGSGTNEDPYLVSSYNDWMRLSVAVSNGHNYWGKVFRMTADIDAQSTTIGAGSTPFNGTFDGDGHTLTFNAGSESWPTEESVAPFVKVANATIRHLHTTGTIYTQATYSAGIVSELMSGTVKLLDCSSDMIIKCYQQFATYNAGILAFANLSADSVDVERCTFTGVISAVKGEAFTTWAGGLLGESYVPVRISHSLFNPAEDKEPQMTRGSNFISMANEEVPYTLTECYTTFQMEDPQGVFVTDRVLLPKDFTYEFVGEPDVIIDGRKFYKNGRYVNINPLDVAFNHWYSPSNAFISDPWTMGGKHQLKDMVRTPRFVVYTSDIPEAETIRTLWGVTYRYLSRRDYHYFLSNEDCEACNWKFESFDADANLVWYDANGDASEITAVVGYDESDYNDDGVQIHNDLVGDWRVHTHLGLIAPHAFKNSSALKTLYFKDTDANNYNALTPLLFYIGEGAFENCTNFTEMKLMQYTTKGDNHWEGLQTGQVFWVADNAFDGCNNLKISTYNGYYQDYLASTVWKAHRSHFTIYEATDDDFTEHGVKYRKYRDAQEKELVMNDTEGITEMMNKIRTWSAEYKQFNASTLLNTDTNHNVYFTSIVGVDDDDIDDEGGVMRIYNDPGSLYNYKTINLQADAIKGNTHVKYIEFWQTCGRSSNSYSELKMVIPNGAFKGCKELKELRMFYYVEDGNDHWETLGPQDVIPGDNIFGEPRPSQDELAETGLSEADQQELNNSVPKDFKIIVAPSRYQEFLNDPNWAPYLCYMQVDEYDPQSARKDFHINDDKRVTYGYITNPGGLLQTSQTVSQDVSWWTAPRILVDVVLAAVTFGSAFAASGVTGTTVDAAVQQTFTTASAQFTQASSALATAKTAHAAATAAYSAGANGIITEAQATTAISSMLNTNVQTFNILGAHKLYQELLQYGVINEAGVIIGRGTMSADKLVPLFLMAKLSYGSTIFDLEAQVALKKGAFEIAKRAMQRAAAAAAKKAAEKAMYSAIAGGALTALSGNITTATVLSTKAWGGSGSYNGDALRKGMRENILSNIHQVGVVGGGWVITTPQKNLVYHTYVKEVNPDDNGEVVIYAGTDDDMGYNTNSRTMTFGKDVFHNKTNLKKISFYENNVTTNEAIPMLLTIPDSAFYGCSNLQEFNTLLRTKENGTQALGPESFVLAGDSIFAGMKSQAEVDSLTAEGQGDGLVAFRIVIDPSRKQDYLDNASWAPLEKFFVYESAKAATAYREYGGAYAYVYANGSVKKVHKVQGHKVEHMVVVGSSSDQGDDHDDTFLADHSGALKLCNDIGEWNNFQLDAVRAGAFKNNQQLRSVYFTDLYGSGAFGDSYTGLDVTLEDECFAGCTNLADLDLLYLVTDGTNHIDPITPQQVKIGKDVFKDTEARIKMMPQQVAWFEADSTWAVYKDRFLPCVVKPVDEGIKDALGDMAYKDMAATGYDTDLWSDYIDYARIAGKGFNWLDGRFTDYKDEIRSFPDFKHFESVGLDSVGGSWFRDCAKLSNILLPSTIKTIGSLAFYNCSSLTEIELPMGISNIGRRAFDECENLNTIVVRDSVPATCGIDVFHKHDGLKIYVPTPCVEEYKTQWSDYKDYIVGDNEYAFSKVVTVDAVGQLASKLGLTLEKERGKVRYINGNYAKYDSLTVIGPLNGEDIAVIRHLAGADAYDSDPTDGKMRYLNLWNADIKKDSENCYNGNWSDEYIDADNKVPDYFLENCRTIETVVLPKSATYIGENTFEDASSLKRVCVGSGTTGYECDIFQNLESVEELVLLTDQRIISEWSGPWDSEIQAVFTLNSLLGDYMGDPNINYCTHAMMAPLEEDIVMKALAEKGQYFPTEYMLRESVEGLFEGNEDIQKFDDFFKFQNVKELSTTFKNCKNLTSITLPASLTCISADAFAGCEKLDTIHISADSIPELAPKAFETQVSKFGNDFHILVPKTLCKKYREQWPEYAEYINADNVFYSDDKVITVVVTKKNTLASALGLTATIYNEKSANRAYITGLRGDFSKIRRLKVVGPISGGDLSLLRYMAGYCPWTNDRNYLGPLEYLDLYDATIEESNYCVAKDMLFWTTRNLYVDTPNVLPAYSFLQCYNLKTLILPKTLKEVRSRALQQCEALETLVIGDDCEVFNWDALNDDAMLTRMYILTNKKLEWDTENTVWRALCNNYNPTFEAFYVKPSQLAEYSREAHGEDMTSHVDSGVFSDDESFAAFASHAAASADDLAQVNSVSGWFDNHTEVKDLTPLGYTTVDSLHAADMQKLTLLEKIEMPVTLKAIEDSAFVKSTNLRYVDMYSCDSTVIVDEIRTRGFAALGIDSLQTLVYVPSEYGVPQGVNIIVGDTLGFNAETFRLVDAKDYCVPYAFKTQKVENSRTLAAKGVKYTVCLPYEMSVPAGAKAYKLTGRDGNTLIFTEEMEKLTPFEPYLIVTNADNVSLATNKAQSIPVSGGNTYGHQVDGVGYVMRGTLSPISNTEAAELGAYILQASDSKWHPVQADNENAYIPAFRAFLLPSGHAGAKSLSIELVDGVPTGIDEVTDGQSQNNLNDGSDVWYDLSGRRLNARPERGIYIHNGHKVIVK
ncbi:MAG: leucine-rich repeat domain-containing protein [Prevotella sp.]|nr:leucine-rich repeat domain-containing protein [Prevotella sp.]